MESRCVWCSICSVVHEQVMCVRWTPRGGWVLWGGASPISDNMHCTPFHATPLCPILCDVCVCIFHSYPLYIFHSCPLYIFHSYRLYIFHSYPLYMPSPSFLHIS